MRRRRLASAIPLLGLVIGFVCCEPLPAPARNGLSEARARPSAESVPSSSPQSGTPVAFVQVRDGRFRLGGQPFVLRGTNYFGSWRERSTVAERDSLAQASVWEFYDDWNPDKVDLDFQFMRSQLNATVVRIGTPAQIDFVSLVQYHGFQPWYNSDGTITDHYKSELVNLADIAYKNNIRIQFCLLWNVGSEIAKDGDAFKPGGPMDAFYSHQVGSIASALKNHPGVIAYSIGNEVLVNWKINGTHTSWFEPRAGAFILRRLRDVRAAAPLQLLASDEVASPSSQQWHSPSPEFALLPDADNSDGYQAFRLVDKVDYLGPHFYPETLTAEDLRGNPDRKLDDALQQLTKYMQAANAYRKPVALGEFGLKLDPETLDPGQYSDFRDEFFQRVLAKGQVLGLQGALAWLALPQIILRPGHFSIETSKENKYSPIEVRVETSDGDAKRVLFYKPHFSCSRGVRTATCPARRELHGQLPRPGPTFRHPPGQGRVQDLPDLIDQHPCAHRRCSPIETTVKADRRTCSGRGSNCRTNVS